ncbi:MAG: mevalonate kinase [Candidatus Heimdallarchaeaceae archaeon]
MDVNTVEFSAPGKIILFGEHAVVYKHPAIAAAIDLRAISFISASSEQISILSVPDLFPKKLFDLNLTPLPENLTALKFVIDSLLEVTESSKNPTIEISSQIPLSAGLGSSAAVSVSLIAGFSKFLGMDIDLHEINKLAYETEKIIHSFPSGIDNTISTYGGGILYENGVMKELSFQLSSNYIVIINSLIPRNTKDLVESVRKKYEKNPSAIQGIFHNIHNIVIDAEKALKAGDLAQIGELMSSNHQLLRDLGVSHRTLDEIVKILDEKRALGSKLTGAGGGGCVISLFDDYHRATEVVELMKEKNLQAFISNFSNDGVRNELY